MTLCFRYFYFVLSYSSIHSMGKTHFCFTETVTSLSQGVTTCERATTPQVFFSKCLWILANFLCDFVFKKSSDILFFFCKAKVYLSLEHKYVHICTHICTFKRTFWHFTEFCWQNLTEITKLIVNVLPKFVCEVRISLEPKILLGFLGNLS